MKGIPGFTIVQIAVFLAAVGLALGAVMYVKDARLEPAERLKSDVEWFENNHVIVDPVTGCHYVRNGLGGGVTARLTVDGKVFCQPQR